MNTAELVIAVALIVSVLSWFATRYLIAYLTAHDLVDRPNERTLHQGVVPRGGGLVIAVALLLSLLAAGLLSGRLAFFTGLSSLVAAWALLAWSDDRQDLSPRFRFAMQSILAVATVLLFGWINQLGSLELGWLGAGLTVLGIIWLANLYNFMDGMDGLAASQSIIASITLGFWFYMVANLELMMVCVVVAASNYGFLLWNWRPAKIFMGDVGSITLGAFFATMIVIAATRHGFPVISLILIFAVFVADASITIGLRAWRREKVWLPHNSHFYQRLANIGVSHTKIVSAAIVMMLFCSLIGTLTVLYRDMIVPAVLGVLVLIASVVSLVIWLESRHHRKAG